MKTGIYWQDPKCAVGRCRTDPGCVLYLPLHKLDGASFMSKDAYGHLCTVTGALWTPRGRSFDGSDDYINLGDVLDMHTYDWTIQLWIKRGALDISHVIVGKSAGGGTGAERCVFWFSSDNKFYARLGKAPAADVTATGITLGTEEFHLVEAIFDRDGNLQLGLNGENVGTAADLSGLDGSDIDTSNDLRIGCDSDGTAKFNGIIGEVWMYQRCLTLPERQRNYLATKWRYQ